MKPGVRLRLSFSIPELYLSPYPNHSFALPYPTLPLSPPLDNPFMCLAKLCPEAAAKICVAQNDELKTFPKLRLAPPALYRER